MKPSKKLLFIVNPKAGTRSKKDLPHIISENVDSAFFEFDIQFTERAQHATHLAKAAVESGVDVVVAVGGDGTVNEVAQGLLGTDVALAILPLGSGNGLARHLNVSMNIKKTLKELVECKEFLIDTGKVNGQVFLCTAGVGFDAKVSHQFSKQHSRGFFTYAKVALTNLVGINNTKWSLSIEGKWINTEAILITVANANQYGNNAYIAPKAHIQDGLFDVCTLTKFPFISMPLVLRDLFNKALHENRFYTLKQAKQVVIKNAAACEGHIDGEPVFFEGDIIFEMCPSSLKVFAK